jgi:hypothetical protein
MINEWNKNPKPFIWTKYYSRCLSLCSWAVASGDVRTFN